MGDETHPKIDVAALRRHRANNTNPARRASNAISAYSASRAKREAALAERALIDLDEKKGLLVPRLEIESAIYDAGAVLLRDMLELGPQLAERLAAMDQPREIAALLETELRRVLATLASSLRADAAAENEPRPT